MCGWPHRSAVRNSPLWILLSSPVNSFESHFCHKFALIRPSCSHFSQLNIPSAAKRSASGGGLIVGDLDLDRAQVDPLYLTFVRAFLVSADNSANSCLSSVSGRTGPNTIRPSFLQGSVKLTPTCTDKDPFMRWHWSGS